MNNDYKNPAFKKLLDSLQQQSWELELLISGFAIFGLFTAIEPIEKYAAQASSQQNIVNTLIYGLALFSSYILLFNLLLHVILRGLWIGALGLRYVSGDIDFEKLNYSEKFKNHLQKKIVSFDRYIGTLENYCSILFAISFLLIFYLIAFALVQTSLAAVGYLISEIDFLPSWLSKLIGIPLLIFLLIGMLLTFIDFITQGLLKKNKWVAKIYFPFYWVFSFLTLSFLYRPLIYNFLDDKFGKKLIIMLTPVYFTILIISSITYQNSNFLSFTTPSSNNFANKENYLELLTDESDFPGNVVIPTKVIRTPYLPVFIPHTQKIEDDIYEYNPKSKPEKDKRGFTSTIVLGWDKAENESNPILLKDTLFLEYIKAFNKIYSFEIDTLKLKGDFYATSHSKGILGFETYLPLRNLKDGKYDLTVKRLNKDKDSIIDEVEAIIPFWYFKE